VGAVRGGAAGDGDIVAAYARLTGTGSGGAGEATDDWCAWEDAMMSPETKGAAVYQGRRPEARLALVRICAHYAAHGAWLEDGVLLREAHRLAGIPGVLTHGRLDMSGPPDTAWLLARAWPGAELTVMEDAGHRGNEAETEIILRALDRFAGR
jgi:proline iminopeptidase